MTFEQLAVRLAGGLAQPVDDDALREAIAAVLPETALGELDGIKALPGMVGAAADTLRKAWHAGVDLQARVGEHPRLHSIASLEAAVLEALPPAMMQPADLVAAGSARLEHAAALFGPIEIVGITELSPVWRPLLHSLAGRVPIRWIAGPRPVPEWLDGQAIEIVREEAQTPDFSAVSAATAYHEAVEAMRWARQLLASGRAEPADIAIASATPADYDHHLLALRADASLDLHFVHGVKVTASREGQAAAALADILLRGLSQQERDTRHRLAPQWPTAFARLGVPVRSCYGLGLSAETGPHMPGFEASLGCTLHGRIVLPETRIYDGKLISPVESLERYFANGGTTILRAAFEHSYFVHPDRVRQNTPLYPDRARLSREHYPKLDRGAHAMWQGREVKLGDNAKAQQAWARYTGRQIERASGYGVRHVWGHPWDPDAFTAGWNLCYMPFWAGMLTERQHPHPELERAVRQAAWDLYFRDDPVCDPPEFVTDPGVDLDAILEGQPILLLVGGIASTGRSSLPDGASGDEIDDRIREIRKNTNQSWSNLRKAVLSLQGKPHEPFGTRNVEATARSVVRRIGRETGLDPAALERRLTAAGR